jgi:trimeric autotransporter adhesin
MWKSSLSIASLQDIRLRTPLLGVAAGLSVVLLSVAVPAFTQQTASANPARIIETVDDSALATLTGNVHPLARPEFDRGAAPLSQPMQHMQLVLRHSPAQEANLEGFLKSVQAKGSPNYHKWVTPEQFGALYGPADADIETLTDWLTNHGFTVNRVAKGRVAIDFSGSAAQVEDAFHTSIHSYQEGGTEFIANTSDPQIPSALWPVVAGITHLNTFPETPLYVEGRPGTFNQSSHRFEPIASSGGLQPDFTGQNGEGATILYTVAADAATIYDTPNKTLNANFSGGATYDGTGVNIGIIGLSAIDTTIVGNYRGHFLGDHKVPVVFNIDNVSDNGLDTESYIDNEISGALAPGASVYYYAATDLGTAWQTAIEDNKIDILSLSYLSCEMALGSSGNTAVYKSWQQAAAQGITVFVAAGDTGPANCDYQRNSQGNLATSATQGFAVNGYASTPYDIAVGGTDFDVLKENFGQYVGTTTTQTNLFRTALGYIPEATWNDSTMNNTTLSENVPWSVSSGNQNIYAGAGGASNCATFTSTGACTGGYGKPEWQKGNGVPNDNARDLPDISLFSGREFYSAAWGVCDNRSGTINGATVTLDCAPDSSGSFYVDGLDGTSSSAPAFAGIMALVVQKAGERQGAAAGTLYSLFNTNPSIFHDITDGNNSVACTINAMDSANCVANALGNDFENGFNAGPGYDLATGLGSVDVTALVNSWVDISLLSVASTSMSPAAITAGGSGTSTITVSPGGGFTGAVNLTCAVSGPSGASSPATCSLSPTPITISGTTAATSTLTVATSSMTTPGSYTITVSAADVATGDVTASASVTATVGSAGSIALSGTSVAAITAGSTGTSTISVTPSGGFTGAVDLTCSVSGPSGATSPATCSLSPALITISGTAAATSTLALATTATTIPGSYNVAVNASDAVTGKVTASTSFTVTVKSAPSIAIAGTSISTIAAGSTGTSTISVTPGGGFTGAVNLTCSITGPSGAVPVPTCSLNPTTVTISGTTSTTSTLTVATVAKATPGKYAVTIDATASGGISAPPSTLDVAVAGFALTSTAATVSSPGSSGTSTITITPTNYTGAIGLGCVIASSPSGANGVDNPTCTVAPNMATIGSSEAPVTVTATVTTTASAATAAVAYPKTNRWSLAVDGAALACILFFGIPARRRSWRSMLGLLVVLSAMAGLACSGSVTLGPTTPATPGTSPGVYTFAVVGTDTVTSTTTASTVFTVTVQ